MKIIEIFNNNNKKRKKIMKYYFRECVFIYSSIFIYKFIFIVFISISIYGSKITKQIEKLKYSLIDIICNQIIYEISCKCNITFTKKRYFLIL